MYDYGSYIYTSAASCTIGGKWKNRRNPEIQAGTQAGTQAGRQAHSVFIVRISYLNWVQNIIFIMITNGSGITIPNGTRWGS